MVNAQQVRAARAWLGWSQGDLAARSGVGEATIARFELGSTMPYGSTLRNIQRALEDVGIEFLFERGVAVGLRTRASN